MTKDEYTQIDAIVVLDAHAEILECLLYHIARYLQKKKWAYAFKKLRRSSTKQNCECMNE